MVAMSQLQDMMVEEIKRSKGCHQRNIGSDKKKGWFHVKTDSLSTAFWVNWGNHGKVAHRMDRHGWVVFHFVGTSHINKLNDLLWEHSNHCVYDSPGSVYLALHRFKCLLLRLWIPHINESFLTRQQYSILLFFSHSRGESFPLNSQGIFATPGHFNGKEFWRTWF